MARKRTSGTQKLVTALQRGRTITPAAARRLGVGNLSARIREIRKFNRLPTARIDSYQFRSNGRQQTAYYAYTFNPY